MIEAVTLMLPAAPLMVLWKLLCSFVSNPVTLMGMEMFWEVLSRDSISHQRISSRYQIYSEIYISQESQTCFSVCSRKFQQALEDMSQKISKTINACCVCARYRQLCARITYNEYKTIHSELLHLHIYRDLWARIILNQYNMIHSKLII